MNKTITNLPRGEILQDYQDSINQGRQDSNDTIQPQDGNMSDQNCSNSKFSGYFR